MFIVNWWRVEVWINIFCVIGFKCFFNFFFVFLIFFYFIFVCCCFNVFFIFVFVIVFFIKGYIYLFMEGICVVVNRCFFFLYLMFKLLVFYFFYIIVINKYECFKLFYYKNKFLIWSDSEKNKVILINKDLLF